MLVVIKLSNLEAAFGCQAQFDDGGLCLKCVRVPLLSANEMKQMKVTFKARHCREPLDAIPVRLFTEDSTTRIVATGNSISCNFGIKEDD